MDEVIDVNSTSDSVVETPSTVVETEQTPTEVVAPEGDQPQATNPEQGSNKAEVDVLQQIIDTKYKGNKSEFVKGLYEQQNSTAALYRELKELKAQLAARNEPQPEPLESNEDYKALSEEITALDQQLVQNEGIRSKLLGQFNNLQKEIAILDGRIQATQDPATRNHLEMVKWQKQQQQQGLESSWSATYKEDNAVAREKKLIQRQLKEVEKSITSSRAQQQQQLEADYREQQSFLADFESAVDAAIEEKALTGKVDRGYLLKLFKSQAAFAIATSQNQDGIDPFEFVKSAMDEYLGGSGLAAKQVFQQVTQQKLATTQPIAQQKPKPSLNNIPPTNSKSQVPKFKTGDEAREFALKRMQALTQKG